MQIRRPPGGKLAESAALLARLYAGDRVPREKKPPVFDHLRSIGPWMVSIDRPAAGRARRHEPDRDRGRRVRRGSGRARVRRGRARRHAGRQRRHRGRRDLGGRPSTPQTLRQLVPGLPHVTFVASGAEANEKAMALCRINCARQRRDQGAGVRGQLSRPHAARAARDPLAEQARAVRARRLRSARSRRSRCGTTPGDEPAAPSGFYAAAATGDVAELRERFGDAKDDPLLAAEVASLAAVHGRARRPASTSA